MEFKSKIEVVLDVLNYCPWKCSGCNVDRDEKRWLDERVIERLLKICLSLKNEGARLHHLELGPVDFFSAKNLYSVFDNNLIKKFINSFDHIFITSTLYNISKSSAADYFIGDLLEGSSLSIFIPVEVDKLEKGKYLDLWLDRLNYLKSICEKKKVTLNIYPQPMGLNYETTTPEELKKSIEIFKANTGMLLTLNNTCFRDPRLLSGKKSFLRYVLQNGIKLERYMYQNYQIPDMNREKYDYSRLGFYYTKGEVFLMPYLNQYLQIEDNFFKLTKEDLNSLVAYKAKYAKMISDQIIFIKPDSVCMGCDNLQKCSNQGVISLLKFFEYQGCLFGSKEDPLLRSEQH